MGRLTILLVVFLLTPSLVVASETPSGVPSPGEEAATPAPPDGATGSRTFGVTDAVSHTIGAYAFNPFNSASTYAGTGGTGDRHFTSGGGFFLAPINIPAGAVIFGIEIQGCDTSAVGGLTATLFSNTTSSGGVQSEINHGSVSTGGAAALGCTFFFGVLGTPPVVDNFNRTYYVQVRHGTLDGSNRFSAVRLYYVLQVSPAPAAATFTDVPTGHPFFQFIEALAAAGITSGCNAAPPLYCPDDPVTRGQMAVFISRALGLHFVP